MGKGGVTNPFLNYPTRLERALFETRDRAFFTNCDRIPLAIILEPHGLRLTNPASKNGDLTNV